MLLLSDLCLGLQRLRSAVSLRVDLLLLEDANFVEKGLLERWRGDGVLKQEESTGGRREEVESFF